MSSNGVITGKNKSLEAGVFADGIWLPARVCPRCSRPFTRKTHFKYVEERSDLLDGVRTLPVCESCAPQSAPADPWPPAEINWEAFTQKNVALNLWYIHQLHRLQTLKKGAVLREDRPEAMDLDMLNASMARIAKIGAERLYRAVCAMWVPYYEISKRHLAPALEPPSFAHIIEEGADLHGVITSVQDLMDGPDHLIEEAINLEPKMAAEVGKVPFRPPAQQVKKGQVRGSVDANTFVVESVLGYQSKAHVHDLLTPTKTRLVTCKHVRRFPVVAPSEEQLFKKLRNGTLPPVFDYDRLVEMDRRSDQPPKDEPPKKIDFVELFGDVGVGGIDFDAILGDAGGDAPEPASEPASDHEPNANETFLEEVSKRIRTATQDALVPSLTKLVVQVAAELEKSVDDRIKAVAGRSAEPAPTQTNAGAPEEGIEWLDDGKRGAVTVILPRETIQRVAARCQDDKLNAKDFIRIAVEQYILIGRGGAMDDESAALNEAFAKTLERKASGETKVRWGLRGAPLYNAAAKIWLPRLGDKVKVYVDRLRPFPSSLAIEPLTDLPDYEELFRMIKDQHWDGVSKAVYRWTIYKNGHQQVATDTITLSPMEDLSDVGASSGDDPSDEDDEEQFDYDLDDDLDDLDGELQKRKPPTLAQLEALKRGRQNLADRREKSNVDQEEKG